MIRDRQVSTLVALAAFLCLTAAVADFQDGEFVPTSRRGQFHEKRTEWHDLLGRHCPRFGMDGVVAIPIPQPKGYLTVEGSYKIQFAFAGDRLYTPWLKIIGKQAPDAPVVKIRLVHTGPALVAVKAQVEWIQSDEFMFTHHQLLREFNNASYWPKHLLVDYTWEHSPLVNAVGGLYLLFATGLAAMAILGGSVIMSYDQKLRAFLADITAEDTFPAVPFEKGD